jgi:hypothetical protein
MENHRVGRANRQHPHFTVIPPKIGPLQRWPTKQDDRQIERQIAFKAITVAFALIPFEISLGFWDDDIRHRPIYVKDVSSLAQQERRDHWPRMR